MSAVHKETEFIFKKEKEKIKKKSTPTVGTSRLLDEDRPSKKHPKLSILVQTFSKMSELKCLLKFRPLAN
jgi:hypothetical protein